MLSVILVNYNGAPDTVECIRSIHTSTDIEYRIIVVDNASTDDSYETLKKANDKYEFELIKTGRNRGFSAGNNIGISRAMELGTDQVLLLNNDTLVEPDTLKRLVDGLIAHKACALTIGKIYYQREKDKIWYAGGSFDRRIAKAYHWRYGEKDYRTDEKDREVTFATGCCMCMSVEVIQAIGLLDEDYFLYEEDADYCLRITGSGYKMYYIPKAHIYHKISSSTGKVSGMTEYYTFRNKLMLIKKHMHGFEKIPAYGYSVLRSIFGCLKGEQVPLILFKAFIAFIKNESGKARFLI